MALTIEYLKMPRKAWGSDFCTQVTVQGWAQELQPSILKNIDGGKEIDILMEFYLIHVCMLSRFSQI